jgi:hypothetical protein
LLNKVNSTEGVCLNASPLTPGWLSEKFFIFDCIHVISC